MLVKRQVSCHFTVHIFFNIKALLSFFLELKRAGMEGITTVFFKFYIQKMNIKILVDQN